MRNKFARAAGLTGLAAGVLALAGATAGPALAGTTDTGGTVVVALRHSALAGLAKAGIVVLPTGSGAASYSKGYEKVTLQVTGGNASFIGTYGSLDLAGSLEIVDGATHQSVTLTKLTFDYTTGNVSGAGSGQRVVIGQIGGAETGQQHAGPPTSETFTASALFVTKAGAKYLDAKLHTKYFTAGADLGTFAANYDTATSS
jgi:hypothetical protein